MLRAWVGPSLPWRTKACGRKSERGVSFVRSKWGRKRMRWIWKDGEAIGALVRKGQLSSACPLRIVTSSPNLEPPGTAKRYSPGPPKGGLFPEEPSILWSNLTGYLSLHGPRFNSDGDSWNTCNFNPSPVIAETLKKRCGLLHPRSSHTAMFNLVKQQSRSPQATQVIRQSQVRPICFRCRRSFYSSKWPNRTVVRAFVSIAYRLSPIILATPGTAFMPGRRAEEHRTRQYQLATCKLSSTVAKEF
jgi:hypothetical protein